MSKNFILNIYVKYDILLQIKLTQGGCKMIIFNQTQDFFSPNKHYEVTPSQIMDREFKASLSKISDLPEMEYLTKRFSLERAYQQIFFEEDVDVLLSYAVATVNLITKIREQHQDFPMINFDFWDPRDFPLMYAEYLELYSKTTEVKNSLPGIIEQVPVKRIWSENTYIPIDIKIIFIELKMLYTQIEKVNFLRRRINNLLQLLGNGPAFLDTLTIPEDITLQKMKAIRACCEEELKFCMHLCDALEFLYKKSRYQVAAEKIGNRKGMIFSTIPYVSPANFNQIPQMNENNTAFIVRKNVPSVILEKYLHNINFSEKYFVTYF